MTLKRYTIAQCFRSFALPYILFVEDFQLRRTAIMTCCIAWNISLAHDAREREDYIEKTRKMLEPDDADAATLDFKCAVRQGLCSRVAQKRILFPWAQLRITKTDLIHANGHDVLVVTTGSGKTEEIKILARPLPSKLPLLIEELQRLQKETAAQVRMLTQAASIPCTFTDIEITQMTTAYCVQRADLIVYQRIMTVWRDHLQAPTVKQVLSNWLGVLNKIEADTKAVLNILVRGGEY